MRRVEVRVAAIGAEESASRLLYLREGDVSVGVGEKDGDPAIRPNYVTNRTNNGDFSTAIPVRGTPEADARLVVSSLYRTIAQQEQLAGVNPSATRGRSSHSYGASIDVRALETTGDCKRALKHFEDVLKAMRKERRLLVIREGACLHLTARR